LLSQFADDTTLYLDGSERSFLETINVLTKFSQISGLKINLDKTQIIWIGSRKNCGIQYMRDKIFVWDPGTFKILGVKFSTDINSIVQMNYDDKLLAMRRILASWKKRQITPFGKITVIKTLVFSKIVHLLISLPDPPDDFITALDKELYIFLWNGKKGKIKKSVIDKEYSAGGLKMLNVMNFISAMKISWLCRLARDDSDWKIFTINMFPRLDNVEKFGAEYGNSIMQTVHNPFWKDVIRHYKKLYLKCEPTSVHEFMSECIHYKKCKYCKK
jgi:hypothetical protein